MIHATNIKTGLIGEKLGHSFSPQIHSYLADYEYKLYEIPEDQVENFVKNSVDRIYGKRSQIKSK